MFKKVLIVILNTDIKQLDNNFFVFSMEVVFQDLHLKNLTWLTKHTAQ